MRIININGDSSSLQGGITLNAGMYSVFLGDWFKVYPKSHFHIIKAENYYREVSSTLGEVFAFLGIKQLDDKLMDNIKEESVQNSNKSNSTEPMLPETRQLLNDLYKPFNGELAELLGNTEYLWK